MKYLVTANHPVLKYVREYAIDYELVSLVRKLIEMGYEIDFVSQAQNQSEEEIPYVPRCDFKDCKEAAQYEGWFKERDFAGVETGLLRKMNVCKEHVKHLNGYNK